jgi:alpha-D-glucose phosphate-specific phosphoglucomutase
MNGQVSGPKTLANDIHFGTDGWRAIIDEDFTCANVARVADAAARVFATDNPGLGTIIVGYDTRLDADKYAALAAAVMAAHGFDVLVSKAYCPTPTLCWSVARDERAVGGMMLTSSHNPAEYLGIKLRMADGGASPQSFTDRVEAALEAGTPASFESALQIFDTAQGSASGSLPFSYVDLMGPFLDDLYACVDAPAIAAAGLRVVVDPLYGAGRLYLAGLLERLGVEVVEVNNAADPSFNGLHPEPIPPWIQVGTDKTVQLGFDACFITDGDGDRIGAVDAKGNFVNPHRILTLIIAHLVEDKGARGRVVRTLSGSNLLKRQCGRLGLELTTTPVGFKWIYEEMCKGDVMIGGEESGGIGIPTHVRERDGLLMALLLTELMAQKGMTLGELVDSMLAQLGNLDYNRRDLRLTHEQKDAFLDHHVRSVQEKSAYDPIFSAVNEELVNVSYMDGIKFEFASDAWLLMRASGTEPLVRVYAEAATKAQVEALLDAGCGIVTG